MYFLHSPVPEAFRQRKKSVSLPILFSTDTGGVQDRCQLCPTLPFCFYKALYVHKFLPSILYCAMYFFFNLKNPYPGVGRESCKTVQYLSPFKCDCLFWRMPGASNTAKHMAGLRRSRLRQGAELMAPHAFNLKIWTTIQSKWILSSWSKPHSVCVERLERTLRCPYFITMSHSAAIIPVRYSTMHSSPVPFLSAVTFPRYAQNPVVVKKVLLAPALGASCLYPRLCTFILLFPSNSDPFSLRMKTYLIFTLQLQDSKAATVMDLYDTTFFLICLMKNVEASRKHYYPKAISLQKHNNPTNPSRGSR